MFKASPPLLLVLGIATAGLSSSAHAEVIYRAKTTIGTNVLNDLIVLDKNPVRLGNHMNIQGTLTVPGVFSVPFEGYTTFSFTPTSVLFLSFDAIAKENGAEFKVHYYLGVTGDGSVMSGEASFPDGQRAKVEAIKVFEE